jgi:hypothetical protein
LIRVIYCKRTAEQAAATTLLLSGPLCCQAGHIGSVPAASSLSQLIHLFHPEISFKKEKS